MTLDNIRKDFEWFTFLASGEFTERNFDIELKAERRGEEAGRSVQGEMPDFRKKLIIADATNHLNNLINKVKYQKEFAARTNNAEKVSEIINLFPEIFKEEKIKK